MPIKCPNCGARIQNALPGQLATCAYCKSAVHVPHEDAGAPQVHLHVQSGVSGRTVALIASGLTVAVFGLVISVVTTRPSSVPVQLEAPAGITPSTPVSSTFPPAARSKPKLTLATLATTPIQRREPIEAPGMVGSLAAFDVVANIDWARSIARAWTRDAELHRLAIDGCDRDGIANLVTTPDAQALYRFISFERIKEFDESTSITRPSAEYELFVYVTKDGPLVQKISGDPGSDRDTQTFRSLPACTLAQAFAALDKANALPLKPVYNADFYDAMHHPAWKIQTLNNTPKIPWVEGPRCRIWR